MSYTEHDNKQGGSVIITEAKDNDVVAVFMPKGGIEEETDAVDAVFGALDERTQRYRSVTTLGAFALLTKANIGLGVLSIPFVFQVLGIVPGIICILILQTMMGYAATIVGSFKLNHPEVYDLADAGYVFGGRWVREILYVFFFMFCVIAGSGAMVSLSAALNAISSHAACTAIFIAAMAAVGFILGSIPTLSRITWIGWVGLICLMASLLTLTISVGVQDRPADAPQPPLPWTREINVIGHPSFTEAMAAISSYVALFFPKVQPLTASFNIVSEMRDPRGYNKAMLTSIGLITIIYLVIGGVVYSFCGQYVSSPALGSAGPLMKKVCYGLVMPSILAGMTIFMHLGAKHVFIRVLRGSHHLTHPTRTHYVVWFSTVFGITALSYIFASAIPNFSSIIGFFGALVVPACAIIPYPFMWWHDSWRYATPEERTTKRRVLLWINMFIALVGFYITIAGVYGAGVELVKASSKRGPWSCADNS
ncbi:N amino acid transport system protein [Vanrija pseudolonga]|uniref:N amino acid transport system protein n=1 Tax=Vanrija pseudolonga TaxID=143232 RepID=A0AAF1BHD2_9TREE|nr:N amino acid transport system protein [Vanrija pseudolonga]